MPSARYYREQAQVLLSWALATSDPDYATRLTARAMESLAMANQASGGPGLSDLIEVFNDAEMRKSPQLQQQQRQTRKDEPAD